MSDGVITLREFILGTEPYVVIRLTGAGDDGAIKASLDFGGGLDMEDVRELLEMMSEQFPAAEDGAAND